MKNLRLLIVDDEEASRYGMRRALESLGYEIAEDLDRGGEVEPREKLEPTIYVSPAGQRADASPTLHRLT